MITREQAIALLKEVCSSSSSTELCSQANPGLWAIWCDACKRVPDPSNVWTELDVVQSCVLMLKAYLQECSR